MFSIIKKSIQQQTAFTQFEHVHMKLKAVYNRRSTHVTAGGSPCGYTLPMAALAFSFTAANKVVDLS